MSTIKHLVFAGVIAAFAAPAFAGAATATSSTHWVAKKKKKTDDKCDATGKPCKEEGEDCKASNCKPAEPAPQQ